MQTFASFPLIDGHVHFVHPERMDEMLTLMGEAGCKKFNIVCVPNTDGTTHNPAALYFKQHYPEQAYISGALDYRPVMADPGHGAEELARQVRLLKAQGFDGLKLIEGKPQVRKLLPYALDGELYAQMWQALEDEDFPVVFHVADPDEFWDAKGCPEWAKQSGWDYSDGSYPSKEALYTEVDNILVQHPRLKIVFAHFYFLSADLARAADFLEAHPQVCFDLAPHLGMYRDFSRNPTAAHDFFVRFQERIIYGTDTDTRALVRSADGYRFMQSLPQLIRAFLERDREFNLPDGTCYHGLGLPRQVLEKIYHANFERRYGLMPVPLSKNH